MRKEYHSYPLEWLDLSITVTLNPTKTNVRAITDEQFTSIINRIPEENLRLQKLIKTHVFSITKEEKIAVLIRQYHSSLIALLDQIAPREVQSDIMKWAFKELAKNMFSTEQVWKMAKEKGLKCSKNNFWTAIRNPMYCGKIFIPKYKDEESQLVMGQHEPLISEALFYDVQDVLDGRKKVMRAKIKVDNHYPLRGFVICPDCGRMLTGSKSKGRSQYYYYYHCSGGCKFRQKAEFMNEKIVSEIGKYVYSIPKLNLFKEVIASVYKAKTRDRIGNIQQLKIRLQDENNKLSKARELLLCGDIEADDYRMMKADADKKINRLEAKLTSRITDTQNVEPLWDKAISNLSQLGYLYETGTITQKRKIIGSVFPENLTFDGFEYRTTRVNEAIKYITLIDKDLNGNKNGTNSSFLNLSHQVTQEIQISEYFIEDLKRLVEVFDEEALKPTTLMNV